MKWLARVLLMLFGISLALIPAELVARRQARAHQLVGSALAEKLR